MNATPLRLDSGFVAPSLAIMTIGWLFESACGAAVSKPPYSILMNRVMMRGVVNTSFRVRPMSPNDFGELEGIIDTSFSWFVRSLALHSVREQRRVLISEAQGTVVGFVKLTNVQVGSGKFGRIQWIAVHPQFRRQGIATALVNAGFESLTRAEAKAVFATVRRLNTASLTVFGSQGFRKIGFLELWRLFGLRIFEFYREIWLAPWILVLMHD